MYLHTQFEESSFILFQDIVRKPPSIENRSTASVTLRSGSRSTIYNPMLAPKEMYLHTQFEEPSFILSQDIVQIPHDKSVTDKRMDRPTDGRTDGQTEKAKPICLPLSRDIIKTEQCFNNLQIQFDPQFLI